MKIDPTVLGAIVTIPLVLSLASLFDSRLLLPPLVGYAMITGIIAVHIHSKEDDRIFLG